MELVLPSGRRGEEGEHQWARTGLSARTWERNLGLFVLIIVGLVVAQTWYDWRKNSKELALPEWAKGVALGGVLAICLAALTSYAIGWMQESAMQSASPTASWRLWPELALLAVSGSAIFLMTRKRRWHWLMLLVGMVFAAFCIGMYFGS